MGQMRETLRSNLEAFILRSGRTQKEIAEELNVSKSSVTNWIKGKNAPDVDLILPLCELLGVPYTGSGVLASALAMDKTRAKTFYIASGLPTPHSVTLHRGQGYDAEEIIGVVGEKCVVKPAREGSARIRRLSEPNTGGTTMAGIFKAYDIRGVYGTELTEDVVRDIARAFVTFLGCKKIAVGRDCRVSSGSLFEAFAAGATELGADVVLPVKLNVFPGTPEEREAFWQQAKAEQNNR